MPNPTYRELKEALAPREYHTTEVLEPCKRKVKLTRDGKRVGSMPSALYRGQLFHESLRVLHSRHGFAWSAREALAAVGEAHRSVEANAARENRPLTKAVLEAVTDTQAEVVKLLSFYPERLAERFNGAELVGCELPCRFTLTHESLDEPAVFASHLDLLWVRKDRALEVYDFKSGADAPTWEYLSRNIQFGIFALMVAEGEIDVAGGLGEWEHFGAWPSIAWVHLNNLAPYARKTTVRENDQDVSYTAGQHRPLSRIVQYADIDQGGAQRIKDELALLVRMDRAGMYPAAPDPIGCYLCEAKTFCPNFSERG